MPSEDSLKRLPFIRYLYNLGIQQSRQPKPLNTSSILTFHDSVELFLHLACEELYVEIRKDIRYMEYWGILKGKLSNGRSLGYESQMQRLNMLRVGLKHHGIIPDESEIERARVNTTNFFEESVPIIFNVPFDRISMTDLVVHVPARECLKEATTHMEQGKFGEALGNVAIAFEQIIEDYEGRKESIYRKSLFHFGLSDPYSARYRNMDRDTIEFVNNSIEPMHKAMKIMSLGLDYRRYVKFRLLVPEVKRVMKTGGGFHYFPTKSSRNHTKENCQFCYNFVIDSAIRIQDFDFDIEKL